MECPLAKLIMEEINEFNDISDTDLDDDCNNDDNGYGGDSESDGVIQLVNRKRGRPKGSSRKRHYDTSEDEFTVERMKKRKRQNAIDTKSLAAIVCCASLCLAALPTASIDTLKEHIGSMTKSELNQWTLDWLWTHPKPNGEFCYLIGEWSVCLSAFLSVIGVPFSTFYTIKKRYSNGEKVIGRQGILKGQTSSATQLATLWLHDYANKFAEKLPDQMKLHLPPCLTKLAVHDIYTEEMNDSGEKAVSLSHFYWIWRNCVSYVSIPVNSRLSKCNICVQIKTKLSETKDKGVRTKLQKQREKHLLKQSMERRKYYKHVLKSRQNPDKYLSIIIDGMDQSKTEIPHFMYLSSLTKGMWKLRTHLIGAIVHGIGVYGFFDYYQYPHSSNLTIHVLLHILNEMKDSLPDTLYLQMDNCARENKNKYVFAFLCILVERKIFKKIKVSFLMVGHTHEDIDQVFSRFSHWLNKHSAKTLPCLLNAFEKCFSPSPQSIEVDNVFDVTGWLQESIKNVSGHSQPHAFKIHLDKNGKAKLVYKKWANDKIWLECQGTDEHLLSNIPSIKPKLLLKNDDKIDAERLIADVNKVHEQYGCNTNGWWTKFFSYIGAGMQQEDDSVWLLDAIVSGKQSQNERIGEVLQEDNDELVIKGLANEDVVPVVTIGKANNIRPEKTLKVDDLCLVNCAKYAGEWPQLAKVVEITDTNIKLHWYKGSKSSPWTPCTVPAPGCRGKRIPWIEDVAVKDIWCFGFCLTGCNKLTQKIREKIDNFQDF